MAELQTTQLPDAARMHLRAVAAGIDVAETEGDVANVTKAALAYLQLRQAYGLAGAAAAPLDPFAAFVAGMAMPTTGLRDPPDP